MKLLKNIKKEKIVPNNILTHIDKAVEDYIKEHSLCLTEIEQGYVKMAFIAGALVAIDYVTGKVV